MNETAEVVSEPVVVEPWLVRHQRERLSGRTPLTTFQGLIADEIVLPQSAADNTDPAQLVLAADAWVDALLNQAFFLPGEFAPEAIFSFYVRDYLAQVQAGGHAQYYANRGGDELALRCCSAGLKSMLADPHLRLFELMLRLFPAEPKEARRIALQAGYKSAAAAMLDLDSRFAALEAEEPLTPRHKTWLKSLRKLRLAPDTEMNQHLNRIAGANALLVQRKQEAERVRSERMRADPAYQAAQALCTMAGLELKAIRRGAMAPMRSIWAEGPDAPAFIVRADTAQGPRAALFYREGRLVKRYLAVLMEQGGSLPVGSLTLKREDFDAIVPVSPAHP